MNPSDFSDLMTLQSFQKFQKEYLTQTLPFIVQDLICNTKKTVTIFCNTFRQRHNTGNRRAPLRGEAIDNDAAKNTENIYTPVTETKGNIRGEQGNNHNNKSGRDKTEHTAQDPEK